MRAIVFHQHGDLDVLKLEELPDPTPAHGEVVVALEAAALNRLDLFIRQGLPGVPLPHVLGCEGAGHVAAVGAGVTHLKEGDRVVVTPGTSCGPRPAGPTLGTSGSMCISVPIPCPTYSRTMP